MEINKIYHSDFRELIGNFPTTSLIITDPPFNIGVKYGEYTDNETKEGYLNILNKFKGMKAVFIHYPEETIQFICPSMGVFNLKKVVSWVYNSNLPRQHRLITWFNCSPDLSKIKQPYKNMNDRRIKKLLLSGSGGRPIYDWWNIEQVKNVSKEKESYPNQIPEEIINKIIKTTAIGTDIIIDPFCGSGTTCIAARKLGYDFIGIDQNIDAVNITKERLQKTKTMFER